MSSAADARPPLSRSTILAVARELMVARGSSAVSLRNLAAELGVTAPALYAHFENKDALFAALAAEEFDRLLGRLEDSVRGVDDALERIAAQSHAYVEHALERPALFQLMTMFRPAWVRQSAATELPAATQAFEASSVAVRDAIASGRFRETDELRAALTIWAAVHGVATVLMARPGLGADDERALVDSVIDRIIAGLCVA